MDSDRFYRIVAETIAEAKENKETRTQCADRLIAVFKEEPDRDKLIGRAIAIMREEWDARDR